MQISKKKVSLALEKQIYGMLYQLIIDIKTPHEAETILGQILSDIELSTLAKRIAVAYWLTNERSYVNIRENLKVSSATVANVQQELKSPGWKMAIQKIMAEEWASKWEKRIKGFWSKK